MQQEGATDHGIRQALPVTRPGPALTVKAGAPSAPLAPGGRMRQRAPGDVRTNF
ncbi:MAG TPA: hypothetical protein VI138_03405 [Candidatus Dormibacteraeota bacterium]